MMNYPKAQMSGLSEEGRSAGCPQSIPAGVKLEALMEQLQRQQEAKLEMNLQEKHLQTQLLFAQQAAAAARASGSRPDPTFFRKTDGHIYQAAQQALNSSLSRVDPKEDEYFDDEEQEMLEPDENDEEAEDEEEEEDEKGPHQQGKKMHLQQVSRFQPYSATLSAAVEQMSKSPPSAIKQEQEEKNLMSSPAGQHAFTSPNGFADWGYDEPFKQRGSGIWIEDSDGGKVRGEPSRDFAKVSRSGGC